MSMTLKEEDLDLRISPAATWGLFAALLLCLALPLPPALGDSVDAVYLTMVFERRPEEVEQLAAALAGAQASLLYHEPGFVWMRGSCPVWATGTAAIGLYGRWRVTHCFSNHLKDRGFADILAVTTSEGDLFWVRFGPFQGVSLRPNCDGLSSFLLIYFSRFVTENRRIRMKWADVAQGLYRLRAALELRQSEIAQQASLDQDRLSRMEKGEVGTREEIQRVLRAMADLGSSEAIAFMKFLERDWRFIAPPSFWNPERASLEVAEETLEKIEGFLADEEQPWPLRRQLERRKGDLLRATSFLTGLKHDIAFIGDIGVGKSTAISFIFDLLVPGKAGEPRINRPILATGTGRTTICEVHIKSGPEFGISVCKMDEAELIQLVAHFCACKWATIHKQEGEDSASLQVSGELERAIRNMSGFVRKSTKVDGKTSYHDPVDDLVRGCQDEDEFVTRVLDSMSLTERTNTEIWYEKGYEKHSSEWLKETFSDVNYGRLSDVPMPQRISLVVPNFGKNFGEFEISVIDTKGIDDVAVREDLDLRLKDPRTSIVLCCGFRDAPSLSGKILLQHMRDTFSERFDTGKVSLLSLPHSGEARDMKNDMGEQALADDEGYAFKGMQVQAELDALEASSVKILFLDVETDDSTNDPTKIRDQLLDQLSRMRTTMSERLFDLCHAVEEIIENHEEARRYISD